MNPLVRTAEILGRLIKATKAYPHLKRAVREDQVVVKTAGVDFELRQQAVVVEGVTVRLTAEQFAEIEGAWSVLVDSVDTALRQAAREAAEEIEAQAGVIRRDVAADFGPGLRVIQGIRHK